MSNIDSPCIGICAVDENKICQGCFRSMAEILDWNDADEAQKMQIISNSEAREQNSLSPINVINS